MIRAGYRVLFWVLDYILLQLPRLRLQEKIYGEARERERWRIANGIWL